MEVSTVKKGYTKKMLGPAYSSYQGRVHVPLIKKDNPVTLGKKNYLSSGCAGHMVFERSEVTDEEAMEQH